MIIKEGSVIVLKNQARYFLAHEIGELEEFSQGKYYFAVGVTKNETLNANDIIFLEVNNKNGKYTAKRVKTDSEVYNVLSCLEITKVLMDTVPGYENRIITELETLDFLEQNN